MQPRSVDASQRQDVQVTGDVNVILYDFWRALQAIREKKAAQTKDVRAVKRQQEAQRDVSA